MSATRPFPYEIHDKSVKDGLYAPTGVVSVGPHKVTLPAPYRSIAEKIYNFEPREDDVWIATFPRSGTTVTQELVWLIANDLDIEGAKEHLSTRSPYIEEEMFMPGMDTLETMKEITSRRIIKTHLMFNLHNPDLFKKGSKIIYVARNPKDVMVSFYHFYQFIEQSIAFTGDFTNYFDHFMNAEVFYSPYWDHLLQGWENRDKPNFLFLFYENFRKDQEGTIRKVADFLNKPLTNQQVEKLKQHLDIDNFKRNPSVSQPIPPKFLEMMPEASEYLNDKESFVRKGKVGSWKKYLTVEMSETVDRLNKEKFEPVGLRFDC